MAKRVRISFRMDRVIVIRKRGGYPLAWCERCSAEVRFLTVEVAAAVAGVTPPTVYQWVEAGHVHFSESAEGETLICLNALSALFNGG